jgi:hypothetical protein
MPIEPGTSNAAPVADRFRTMQLKAPPGNSIIPALSTCSRCALRLSTVMLIEPNSKKSMNRVAETRGRFWDQGKASVCQNVSNTALKSPKQAHSGRASSSFVPCRLQVQDVSSSVRDLVFAIPVDQPPSSDHFVRSLNAANRTTAAGVVDPASSGNEISVELSLTQRSDPRLFHLPSTASAMKVPKREEYAIARRSRLDVAHHGKRTSAAPCAW